MAKYYSLFGGTTTDTEIQVAKENQIVISEGPGAMRDRLVIYKVEHDANGYMYHLVNLETKAIRRTDILRPYSRKFGIGMYYTDAPAEFMDAFEVAALVAEAEQKQRTKPTRKPVQRPNTTGSRQSVRNDCAGLCPITCRGHRGRTQRDGIHRPLLRVPGNPERPHRNTRLLDHLPQRLRGTAESRR